jgi:DNA-directed RNA polymerase subunit RPC12/RpoP
VIKRAIVVCVDCGLQFDPPGQTGRPPVRCQECNKARLRRLNTEKMQRWREKNPEKWQAVARRAQAKRSAQPGYKQYRRDSAIKAYGLTPEEYRAMIERQGGGCAICGGGPNGMGDFHVDHCHDTKRVRGILCHRCNTMLGLAKDDPARLIAAAEYLNKT